MNLLDDSMRRLSQLIKFEFSNKSNNFSKYEEKANVSARNSLKKEDCKKEEEKISIFFENESGRSRKSNKNKSMVGQYLFD